MPPPPPPQAGAIRVTDQLERRIRKPIDLLRCVVACIEIVALAVAGVAPAGGCRASCSTWRPSWR
jgi:hypothetical protein